MSKIDQLINELCPDGVLHVELSKVAQYSDTRIDSAELDSTSFVGVDNLLSDKGGRTDATYLPNTSRLTNFQIGDVLLGNIRPYLKKVWLADRSGGCSGDVLALRITEEFRDQINPRFLYYLLSSDRFFAYNMQHAKGAKMPRGSKPAILKYQIPLPPLEVQQEIVRILDKFTKLEAELEAELEARQKQYAHYRSELLRDSSIDTILLGDIATIGTGRRDTKDAVDDGEYIFYARGRELLQLDDFDFDEEAVITAGDGAGVGKVFHYATGKFALHQRAYRIVPGDQINGRYLYHHLVDDFARYLQRTSHHASVTSLRKPMFLNYSIALPPLEKQREIAAVLDQFDALVNDLSSGLPAEIAARRKQYEYYRDRLLSFEELSA